ncbi:MAG: VTT domain-containing protein [Geoalkalibacter sp.]|jgi:undecaprenyl-diphosphatase|uniref:VTT domain-containing protein n=1 Tax=Geoalkalibacter sp. TaxID=3041440 RepID=UPI002A981E3D|nr:VTT domain-containing protein [Thermodesulfobacteriota bacterium]
MDPWIETTISWLPSGVPYYLLLGLISLLESLAIVGIFVPGSVLIVMAGFLAAHGQGMIAPIMIFSALGAIIGDLTSFWLGARFGSTVLQRPTMIRRQHLVIRARRFFLDHGGKSVFFGRFLGFLRPFIPLIAGSTHMAPLRFVIYAVISGILWGLVYPGLGYFFAASWRHVQLWSGRFSLILVFLLVLLIVNHLFWRKFFPLLRRLAIRLWRSALRLRDRLMETALARHWERRYPRLCRFVGNRFATGRGTGIVLSLGFLISLVFAALFFWISRAVLTQTPFARSDLALHRLLQGIRQPEADLFFEGLMQFGAVTVILILGTLCLLWLLLNRRRLFASLLIIGLACGQALLLALQWLFKRPPPQEAAIGFEGALSVFPSAAAFNSLVFYGLVVYFLLGSVREAEHRFYLVSGASFLVLVVAFSPLYLGMQRLSDVLGGLVLGGCWLAVLITAGEMPLRHPEMFPADSREPVIRRKKARIIFLTVMAIAAAAIIAALIAHL